MHIAVHIACISFRWRVDARYPEPYTYCNRVYTPAQITNDLRQIDLSCEVGVVQCPAGGGESRFFIPPF
ncbi:hypothetical protein PC118_g4776 [Phytophthora cactorum]|uniref:Uncharacterized protein n=1 Tax=Phytophthora cactorum TaxID=29920 RepID=A0A8T1GIH8_9STRA|nr:hypothetical protein PC111_g7475 [Phytophthora cactorum]KAG2832588.1 hypothetical protein PC112_g6836 [Phytophthora cactorum]KAG2859501.1 hypothetical protein PC113_g8884 [Phytophthora cactorum]KAG2992028.1 hypothetical protein PC118_g4776 [Phytophthora cactorum]KAG3180059.1 hypothetical protein C6341_g7132 [Phytophthora cactorum]